MLGRRVHEREAIRKELKAEEGACKTEHGRTPAPGDLRGPSNMIYKPTLHERRRRETVTGGAQPSATARRPASGADPIVAFRPRGTLFFPGKGRDGLADRSTSEDEASEAPVVPEAKKRQRDSRPGQRRLVDTSPRRTLGSNAVYWKLPAPPRKDGPRAEYFAKATIKPPFPTKRTLSASSPSSSDELLEMQSPRKKPRAAPLPPILNLDSDSELPTPRKKRRLLNSVPMEHHLNDSLEPSISEERFTSAAAKKLACACQGKETWDDDLLEPDHRPHRATILQLRSMGYRLCLILQALDSLIARGTPPSMNALLDGLAALDERPSAPAEEEEGSCIVCWERERTHAVVPCGHMVLCEGCVRDVEKSRRCPKCREKWKMAIRVWK
ncbi:hypothetical protein DFJ74DRAFT_367427 [Hyaloraphidium curvatum]|nr:hypothetical protein DFJ74DRAFT_367427 [Hyaloraphidium curvatum]